MIAPLQIFCCYARKDQEMLEDLKKHLMPLQRSGLIQIWSDTNLNAGMEWEKELHQHLESADIILLLISPDFISSDYCYSTEMARAIERHDQGSAHIIPILLRPVHWDDAPFAKLQILPTNASPVTKWSDRDDAFHDITGHIKRLVSLLQTRRILDQAHTHENAGRYKEALACYEQVLRLDRQHGAALFGRARILYRLGNIDASLEAFTLAEQTAPAARDLASSLVQADALQQRKRYAESLTIYDQALLLDPSNASIHAKRATILIKQKAYHQALNALEQAIHLKPKSVEYYTQAGHLLFRLRCFEQALAMYEQASKLQPREAGYHAWQGKILLHLRRYENALAAYKQALTIAPQAHFYEQAGKICLQLARYQEAMEWYERAIGTTKVMIVNVHDHYFHAGKGQALLQLERYDEALPYYQSAISLSAPNTDPQYYHNLATLHEHLAQRAHDMEEQRRAVWQPETEADMFLVPAFDPTKLTLLHTLNGHKDEVNGIAISPDGKTLASSSDDKTIKLWDLHSGRELRTLTGHTRSVIRVAFSPDGNILASSSADCTIKLRDLHSGRELRTLIGHTDLAWGVAFSPDGNILVSSSDDKTIKLWEPSSGRELRSLSGHTGYVRSLALSLDGNILVSSSDDKTIKLWELPSGRELRSLSGHWNVVEIVAISPDGKTLVSGSHDKTIKLWELPSGHELRTLTGHTNIVNYVAFSPDGKLLASSSADKTIKLWGMEP